DQDLGVIVCAESGNVAGFLCLSTPQFNRTAPGPVTAMIEEFPRHSFAEKSLDLWQSCICGPVCIERDQRGKGLFGLMYEAIPRTASTCDLAVTLVSARNGRSLAAHEKVGMKTVFEFEWNEKPYVTLARLLRAK
ncbi:MAG: hypothetical protein ACRD3W_11990, partial [Terriglobales bacterium]